MMDSHRDEIAKLETLYANNPEGRVFTHLAEAYRKGGQLERAKEILENGLQRHPDYASAHVVLGRVLVDCGDPTNAANEFRRVLELDRHNLVALRSLGDLARGSRRLEEALYYYGELAVLDPSDMGIQDEIRRLRTDLAETQPAPADDLTPTTLETASEPAGFATDAADVQAQPVGAGTDAIETSADTQPASAAETGEHDATGDGQTARATDAAEPASEAETFAPFQSSPDEAGEKISLEGLDVTAGWANIAGTDDQQDKPRSDESAFDAEYGGVGSDLSDVRLDPAFTEAGEAADVPAMEGQPEPGGGDDEVVEVGAAGPVMDRPQAAPDGQTSEEGLRDGPRPIDAPEAAADAEPVVPGAAAELTIEAGPDGPAELTEEEAEARGVAWHEVEGRWTGDQPPSDPEAERRAALGDPGEWIPAERWEWVAASADLASDDPAATEEDPTAAGEATVETGAEPSEETSFAGLVDESDSGPFVEGSTGLDVDAVETDAEVAESGDYVAPGGFEPESATDFDALAAGAEPASGALAESEVEAEPPVEPADPDSTIFETEPPAWSEAEVSARGEAAWSDAADDDEGDQVITETLAEIYASQGLYERAAAVYRRLVALRPADDRLHARLSELERTTPWSGRPEAEPESTSESGGTDAERGDRWLETVESAWTGGSGAVDTTDTPYAWTSEPATQEPTGERVGQFFRSLLDWRRSGEEAAPVVGMAASDAEPIGVAGMHDAEGPESALDDWFAPAEAESAAEEAGRPDGDEDLEMFRSWLKSLKK